MLKATEGDTLKRELRRCIIGQRGRDFAGRGFAVGRGIYTPGMGHTLIYGGTFDPVHHGHLIAARAACEILRADLVLLVPARISPHKTGEPPGASDEQRVEMLRLAIQAGGGGNMFAVDEREMRREGPSYTFDTVEELQRENPREKLTLLIGADQLPRLHSWHRVAELLERAKPAVMARPMAESPERAFAAIGEKLGEDVVRELRGRMLMTPLVDISARNIRFRVRQGLAISFLVPEAVAVYIAAAKLYAV